ncbi:MAG: hypothetical protein M1828_005415 [Chrysothrix sp. TS-e1954]|nr:MAG: hypothetical protein M1828_005415 [Chrysothrix sp. TS-e1954]
MAEPGTRPILPQGPRAFGFAPVNPEPREKQRNYVFVDEHNRHRRLKVMRACAACRRRKIKCDAATTNIWPCGPCCKQQLDCVPPTGDNDGVGDNDYSAYQNDDFGPRRPKQEAENHYDTSLYSNSFSSNSNYPIHQSQPYSNQSIYAPESISTSWTHPGIDAYSHNNVPTTAGTIANGPIGYQTSTPWQPPPLTKAESVASDTSWSLSQADPDFVSALGDLKISEDAVAPYITNQRNTLAEGPAVEERDAVLPISTAYPNSLVGVPPEMMPIDSDAEMYFEHYFVNIHPYIPVISPSDFYHQWHHSRRSISPLVLEGIFACATQMTQENKSRSQWLALGARHEESFKDVPRLSTIQGLIILLKAREAVPKRGYYYRSWMTIQYLISMAKDLELDKHLRQHQIGSPCLATDADCPLKTRIWHALFQLELMVGGPQGRTEYNVRLDTVNFEPPMASQHLSDPEFKISQDQTQMIHIIKNIRITVDLYASLKNQKGGETSLTGFIGHNRDFDSFIAALPQHLQITYPSDGSPPSLPFHYVANLHVYSLLAIVMHHRPQLEGPGANTMGEVWRSQMIKCHNAAVRICLLQEAILGKYGMNGFLSMVAITSPDPELNRDAKDYFVRHMRILERCAKEWPMPAIQVQIDSLRQAFSADLDKPFELKSNFPYGSPSAQVSTPSEENYPIHPQYQENMEHISQPSWIPYSSANITPPRTASTVSNAAGYQAINSIETMPHQNGDIPISMGMSNPQYQWNPARVMESWNTAFNTTSFETPSPGIQNPQAISTPPSLTSGGIYPLQQTPEHSYSHNMHVPMGVAASPPMPAMTTHAQSYMQQPQAATYAPVPAQPYVTPSMWQDAVANSYGLGSKRRWHDVSAQYGDEAYKRMR